MYSGGKKGHSKGDERAVSPVIAVVLMIAITVAVVTVTATVLLGLTETPDPAPDTGLEVRESADGDGYELSNYAGDDLDPDRVRLVGNETEEGWSEDALGSGERVDLEPTNPDGEIRVVWESEDGETQHLLATLTVDEGSAGGGADDDPDPDPDPTPDPDPDPNPDPEPVDCDSYLEPNEDGIIVIDTVIECNVDKPFPVHVVEEGGVIGDIGSSTTVTELMIDDGFVNGTVNTHEDINVTDGYIVGSAHGTGQAHLENAKLYDNLDVSNRVETSDSEIHGRIDAGAQVTVERGFTGDVVYSEHHRVTFVDATADDDIITNHDVEIIDSDVDGDVDAEGGEATLDNANVTGNLWAQSGITASDSEVGGNLDARGDSVTLTDVSVGGFVDGADMTITDSGIEGTVYSGWHNVSLDGTTVENDVDMHGTVNVTGGTIVHGDVDTTEEVNVEWGIVEGDVSVEQEIVVGSEGTVEGDVEVGEEIVIESGVVKGDVDITTNHGEIHLEDGTIEGHAYFDNDWQLECEGNSEINGDDCDEYAPP
ncbi:type IV pilin [Natrarchaeobius sp. A-rgal3]|uniref:type IV pilin n=1 Tax=Natrarchaeobius versutus TaxID=1679078 RepID=UPI00350FA59E